MITLTLDCEPSMSGCAINFSLSYAGTSLSLTMSTTVGIARSVTDHERLPRFDAPTLLECIPVSRRIHESFCSHHSAVFVVVSNSPWETTINDERLKIHDSDGLQPREVAAKLQSYFSTRTLVGSTPSSPNQPCTFSTIAGGPQM